MDIGWFVKPSLRSEVREPHFCTSFMALLFRAKWSFILSFRCDCPTDTRGIDVGRLARSLSVKVTVEKLAFDWAPEDSRPADFGIWMPLPGRRFCDRLLSRLSHSVAGGPLVIAPFTCLAKLKGQVKATRLAD